MTLKNTTAGFNPPLSQPAYGDPLAGGFYAGDIWDNGRKYAIIVAPRATETFGIAWKTVTTPDPVETHTLTNGLAATQAVLADDASLYPAAAYAASLDVGGYQDWYVPARDELELLWRNLKPTTHANVTGRVRAKAGRVYNRDGNTDDTASDPHGINRHSDPVGAAYTSASPAMAVNPAFASGGSEAISYDILYRSSTEAWDRQSWVQYFYSSFPGYQESESYDKTYSEGYIGLRCVRRIQASW